MPYRQWSGAIALCAALCITFADSQAWDDKLYPDFSGQWRPIGGPGRFDISKPPGKGQQAPLTPEYQAKLDEVLAHRARGSLEGNFTVTCLPTGMPRMMIVYETMDIIVLPEMTYIRMTLMNELRRIHTDGRTWPEKLMPTFSGTSIGQWSDEDGDGRYDTLTVETRGMKGPRTYEGTPGIPLHSDNQTIVKERIYLDKSDPDLLRDEITVIDSGLTRPWTVSRKYQRAKKPYWSEYYCNEGNQQVLIGKENYMVSAEGILMPVRKDQPPPDLRKFSAPAR